MSSESSTPVLTFLLTELFIVAIIFFSKIVLTRNLLFILPLNCLLVHKYELSTVLDCLPRGD